ncbi:TatD family deoxyribonuclease [Pseudonocardia sp. TMWB2A]|uniref:TatD family hydrolase n=1 Tax=Pseudonocardia sp. TMWB2A TaxID=687430 RepID=UPI00307EC724
MSTALTDTHCHLAAYPNPVQILDDAQAVDVRVVAVSEDPGEYRSLRTRLGRRDGVSVALGLHPLRAGSSGPHDLARFLRLLPGADWVGEIGLDFSRAGLPTRRRQLQVFEGILADAQLRTRPVTVHSRGAEKETIGRLTGAGVRAILHWFTGPLSMAEDALAAGMYFSVNPAMLRSRSGTALLRLLPLSRTLLETDGPYSRAGNRSATPADLPAVIQTLAKGWEMTTAEARAVVVGNLRTVAGHELP